MEYENLNFDDDKLDRKQFVVNTMRVINEWDNLNNENKSLVLAIDSPWGTGKSYLVNMWKNWTISKENENGNYAVTYYNAWEEDDCENAFIPLLYSLQKLDVYGENEKLAKEIDEKSKAFLKACGIALLKDGVKKIIGDETANILSKGIDAADGKKVEYFFEKYEELNKEKKKFKERLEDLIPENGKLIVFIDELDRCRPKFAIETLEVVKHYFNIENIVFIFSIDLEQLAHSISTMYGQGMDSAGYLRRFFDFNIKIPQVNIKKYVQLILNPVIQRSEFPQYSIEVISNIYSTLRLSLRDIDKITNNFLVFYFYYKEQLNSEAANSDIIKNRIELYLYFMTLKYKYPETYNLILREDYILYDNSPKNWPILDLKYFISTYISEILKDMQTGGARNHNNELISKYNIMDTNTGDSFAEHIEETIEMFY